MNKIKKIPLITTVFLVLCLVCVAALMPALAAPAPQENTEYQPYTPPLYFQSVEEFEAAENKARSGEAAYYYIPAALPDDFTFHEIRKRDDRYITVEYSVDISKIDTAGLSSYGIERISSLICQLKLSENGSVTLQSFINKGFVPIEYQGHTVYFYDDYDPQSTDKRTVGYSIAFLEDGHCIYMHLPAIDTFENMMQYADVVKVTID